jgi:hypothetical protein
VQHDGDVGVPATGTTVRLVEMDRRPSELDHLAPQRAVETLGRRDRRAHTCRRRLAHEQVARGGAQFGSFVE